MMKNIFKFSCFLLFILFMAGKSQALGSAVKIVYPVWLNLNPNSAHEITDKIKISFVNSEKFTIIQWNLKAGAKLWPEHAHPNEQVSRVLSGKDGCEVKVRQDQGPEAPLGVLHRER